VILYLAILGAALYVYWRMDVFQPKVLAMIGPEPTPTPSIAQLTDLGHTAYMEGDLDKAIAYYQQAADLDPENTEVLVALARLLTLDYQLEEALVVAEQAILAGPEDARGYAAKAMTLDWMGKPDEAVIAALRAIELDPDYAPGHAYLSEAYTDLGRWTQAQEQAEMALRLDPYDVDARRNYAYILEFLGDYEGAIQQYLQALQLHPNLLHLWYGLARNYRGAGQVDKAVETFQEIIIRTPDDPEPYTELGKTYFEVRDDAAAQEYLEQAVELVCTDCPLYDGDTVVYSDEFSEQDRRLPENVYIPAWTRLGMVYFTRRNFEDAVAMFTEVIAWGEANDMQVPLEAYYVTGAAYFYLDMCERGVPLLFHALELNEDGRNDLIATDNILKGLVLCRDYADYALTWPEGYPVPEVVLERPGAEGGEADEGEGE
jgi:tetratricopeptide (TPR) repeat protein